MAEQPTYSNEELFRPIDEVRKHAPPLEPLWGDFLFRKAVTSIVGDPGICKTTFGYGLGFALCSGQAFLDIKAEEPVRVLYMDFESADSLIASRANLITEEPMPGFFVYNILELYLQNIAKQTIDFVKQQEINLIFIDNQSMAFNTRDENDNAEAIRQMRLLRSFTVACNTATVVFHHTSKADLPGTRKGTGAFARARLADICINLETPDSEHREVVRFELVKNRLMDSEALWYLRKSKGQFVFTDPPLGIIGRPTDNTIIYQVMSSILKLVEDDQLHKRQELINYLSASFSEKAIHKGIDRLKQIGRISSPQYGFVQIKRFRKLP